MERSAHNVRAANWAQAHGGRITWSVLRALEIPEGQIRTWIDNGWLVVTRPRVYAVGYARTDRDALLWDALLFAGPGAYLTGATGAHRAGLIREDRGPITIATPRHCRGAQDLRILTRRPTDHFVLADGFPVAPPPELILQLAADTGDLTLVRFALSNLEYDRSLDVPAIHAACRRGRAGSTLTKRALATRLPQLADCRSPLEIAFLVLLDDHHLQLPQVNVWVHRVLVDCWWPELRLAVELDGQGNHGTAAQQRRDAATGDRLRAEGITVERFTYANVHDESAQVLDRLGALGVRPVGVRPAVRPVGA